MKSWRSLLFGIFTIMNTSFAAPQSVDKIVAIVNNDIVLESDINDLIQSVKFTAKQTGQELPDDHTLRHHILERLIIDQIILQISRKIGMKITDEQLDQAIANITKRNDIATDRILGYLTYDGTDYTKYRNQVRKEMLISEIYKNEIGRRVNILPQEVDELMKQISNQNTVSTEFNLSYIFIPLSKNLTTDQVDKIENQIHSVIERMRDISNFSKFEISTYFTNQQVLKSGQIGWRHIQDLPFAFSRMLSMAKKGDIIGPVRFGTGFYILKVNDLRDQSQSIFVTEMRIRHILLKSSPIMNDNQARTKLEQIASDIKSGKITFTNAVKKFSQDLDSIHLNGDLGWIVADIYDTNFRDALINLNKGQLSAPIRSPLGWHLIELLDIRNVDKTNTIQKDRAYNILFNRKFSEEATTWIQEQRSCAYVKILKN